MWRPLYPASQLCVSSESKALLCGIISFAPNLSEAAEAAAAAAAPHLNMKVEKTYFIQSCSISHVHIIYFLFLKREDARQRRTDEKENNNDKERFSAAWRNSPVAPRPCLASEVLGGDATLL